MNRANKIKVCEAKIKYLTPNHAWGAALDFFIRKGFDQNVYLCDVCLEYHLTSKKGIVPKFIRDRYERKKIVISP